jgi:ABC-2 type transport system ATP-binding protein/lipopolysaccharide transport system ATP-binding protein
VPAIDCRDVTKRFYLYEHRTTTLQEFFVRSLTRRPIHVRHATFQVTDFTLRVDRGESVALVGPNGSGKSTVLRLIAGIYPPTSGHIEKNGRVVAVIELGASFHTELTGQENIDLYAAALGLTRAEIAQHRENILDFAELGDFIDVPLKYYSSGMRARLAFAVAVCVDPDVLLLDEVLAVGDEQYRERCFERLHRFHAGGGTMLVVSHDLDITRDMCSRAVWLDTGSIRLAGAVDDVVDAYEASTRTQA